MNQLPVHSLSPEEQQKILGQMYLLLGKQVKSYHKVRHMGENTSVPVELARELMVSIEYTINLAGGIHAHSSLEESLRLGQGLLETKMKKAKAMLDLVVATAPAWQTECRWEALDCLRKYLVCYDHLHLAHREPGALFYPISVSVPDGRTGIDLCLFYLHVLWLENQMMAGFDDAALEQLWSRLPADTLNQWEQVFLNGLGKLILRRDCNVLVFEDWERQQMQAMLSNLCSDQLRKAAESAALELCRKTKLADHSYVCAAAAQMVPRLEAAVKYDHLAKVFL